MGSGDYHIDINKEGDLVFNNDNDDDEPFESKKSQSLLNYFKRILQKILRNDDSRKIFYFLCVNLSFCGIEFFFGFVNGSLGLISDGFHMLFDSTALVMGLVASLLARSKASQKFSYGYGRIEVLSGFINALFLMVIALRILLEAVQRLYHPTEVDTDKLLVIAVMGLCVNLFGMYALHGDHGHSHGHGHSQGHSHDHGHQHSHRNANMEGVFLHVLADTLGSVFVIISTLLIEFFGWQWSDPLCSLILSILILTSVFPLLRSSASVLLQCVPNELSHDLEYAIKNVVNIQGVISYSQLHSWQLKADVNVLSIHLQISDESNDQVMCQIAEHYFKEAGFQHVTIQIQRELFSRRSQNRASNLHIPIQKETHYV